MKHVVATSLEQMCAHLQINVQCVKEVGGVACWFTRMYTVFTKAVVLDQVDMIRGQQSLM